VIFRQTPLDGALIVEHEPRHDDRGFLARVFCAEEFGARGLNPAVVQANLSRNHRKGTLRGFHYQVPPATEDKLVWCIRGSLYDVVVDMRPGSPTYLSHFGIELNPENRRGMYIPAMCAHGCQALTDETEVLYLISGAHSAEHERGLRHDDPALGVAWPLPVTLTSAKDAAWPLLEQ
jgi:dTDP-4-dehydrorhamnose 3,5-epimerase